MQKENYNIDVLINDESFRNWVSGKASDAETRYWNQWIELREENRQLAIQATKIILGFTFREPELPNLKEEWHKVHETIKRIESQDFHSRRKKVKIINLFYQVAAAILVFITVGMGIYLYNEMHHQPIKQIASLYENTIRTGNHEIKTINLTDGIHISLKSNSELKYTDGWIQGNKIKVKLNGEAYFSIDRKHPGSGPEFEVITPYGIVRDVGTEFVVSATSNKNWVVLEKGAVRIETLKNKDSLSSRNIVMQPGEMVAFHAKSGFVRRKVNSTLYTSWATGYIRFNNTSVKVFAQRIYQMYDVNVIIREKSIQDKKITGSVYFKNFKELVQAVSKVLKVPMHQTVTGDTLYIGQGRTFSTH